MAGSTLNNARFVPPAVEDMKVALGDLESFLHDEAPMPFLFRVGMAHAQFETIHPFLDGNGRIGRLLITFLLCQKDVLRQPLLYLSYYFKQNRTEYYDRLQAVRDKGEWEEWMKFFLRGVAEVANEATEVARSIISLRERDRALLLDLGFSRDMLRLHELLFTNPVLSISFATEKLGLTFPAGSRYMTEFRLSGILKETTGRQRGRVFRYDAYLKLLEDEA